MSFGDKVFVKRLVFILFLVSVSTLSFATTYKGKIISIGVGPYYDNNCTAESCAVIMADDAYTATAACQNGSWDFMFRTDTATGKNLLSLALAAHAAGQEVVIGGTSYCSLDKNDNAEAVNYIFHKFK
tara:strand:+ start:10243 stop:10626 length:384 start_codon:yes stop_codon:yes gene_type:complete